MLKDKYNKRLNQVINGVMIGLVLSVVFLVCMPKVKDYKQPRDYTAFDAYLSAFRVAVSYRSPHDNFIATDQLLRMADWELYKVSGGKRPACSHP